MNTGGHIEDACFYRHHWVYDSIRVVFHCINCGMDRTTDEVEEDWPEGVEIEHAQPDERLDHRGLP